MLPFFYQTFHPQELKDTFILNGENSKHIVQVLRKVEGDQIHLTNGEGALITATIIFPHKKHCEIKINQCIQNPPSLYEKWIGISFTKNRSRIEWLMEKATEMGINGIIPIQTQRSERLHWNQERLKKILESAMIQSQQTFLPHLHEAVKLENLWEVASIKNLEPLKVGIAHCLKEDKTELRDFIEKDCSHLILIGPEGDFTEEEIKFSKEHTAQPISLGPSRLRTETAGLYVATLLNALTYENK